MQKGTKNDDNKLVLYNMLRQFTLALSEVTKCSQYGHDKYKDTDLDWNNFSRIDDAYVRYSNGLIRHLLNEKEEDDESGLLHDAHVAWNSLARLEVKLRKLKEDEKRNN